MAPAPDPPADRAETLRLLALALAGKPADGRPTRAELRAADGAVRVAALHRLMGNPDRAAQLLARLERQGQRFRELVRALIDPQGSADVINAAGSGMAATLRAATGAPSPADPCYGCQCRRDGHSGTLAGAPCVTCSSCGGFLERPAGAP